MKRKIGLILISVLLCTGAAKAQERDWLYPHLHDYKPGIKEIRKARNKSKNACKDFGEHCQDAVEAQILLERAELEFAVRIYAARHGKCLDKRQ